MVPCCPGENGGYATPWFKLRIACSAQADCGKLSYGYHQHTKTQHSPASNARNCYGTFLRIRLRRRRLVT
jgi:hypothetical protein